MKKLLSAATVAVVIALAFAVWPTPYRYLPVSNPHVLAVRVNRFTGRAEYLMPYGWRAAQPAALHPRADDPLGILGDSTR